MFFTPDPKFHSIHLKYGAQGKEQPIGEDSYLKRLISHSNFLIENTGNRVDPEEWFFDKIISTYVTLANNSPIAATKYLVETEKEFVHQNNMKMTGVGTRIDDLLKRESIFKRAVLEGNKLIQGIR